MTETLRSRDDRLAQVHSYHERTKHRLERYAAGPQTLDWDAQPDPFRRYLGAPLTPLPLAADTPDPPDTPWADRAGENLVAAAPAEIVAGRRYRFVTTDWVAKNAKNNLGENAPALVAHPALRLKSAVIQALSSTFAP